MAGVEPASRKLKTKHSTSVDDQNVSKDVFRKIVYVDRQTSYSSSLRFV